MKVSPHTAQALRTPLSGRRGFEGSADVARRVPSPIYLPSSPARYALGVGERCGWWLANQWHNILPPRLRPHQQLALSSSALPYMPICPVLSWEAPEGSQLAFAPGDVVGGIDATGIRSITERHSLPPSLMSAPPSAHLAMCFPWWGAIRIYPVPLE